MLETALPLFRAGRYMPALLQSMLILAEGYLFTGRYDDAKELLTEALETSRTCEAKGYLAWACRILGEVNLQTDLPSAGPLLEQSIYLFEAMGADNERAKSWAAYGRYLAHSGKPAQAREVLDMALATFERLGTLIEGDNVEEALAQLPESG
jgi:Tfp pilus assembly protein PilF